MKGMKITEISAGKYKRITSQYEPLSKEGRQVIQDEIDYIYSVFVDGVARARGVSSDTVLEDMADGRLFVGRQAVKAGLVDDVITFDDLAIKLERKDRLTFIVPSAQSIAQSLNIPKEELIEQIDKIEIKDSTDGASVEGVAQTASQSVTGEITEQIEKEEVMGKGKDAPTLTITNINVEQLRAKAPEVYDAIHKLGHDKGYDIGHEEGIKEGAEKERQRIKDIEDVAVAGYEDVVAEKKFDGESTGQDVAMLILKNQKERSANASAVKQVIEFVTPVDSLTGKEALSSVQNDRTDKKHEKAIELVKQFKIDHPNATDKEAREAVSRQFPELVVTTN